MPHVQLAVLSIFLKFMKGNRDKSGIRALSHPRYHKMPLIQRIIESVQKRIGLTQALSKWDFIRYLAMCMTESSVRLGFYSYCFYFIIFSIRERFLRILQWWRKDETFSRKQIFRGIVIWIFYGQRALFTHSSYHFTTWNRLYALSKR